MIWDLEGNVCLAYFSFLFSWTYVIRLNEKNSPYLSVLKRSWNMSIAIRAISVESTSSTLNSNLAEDKIIWINISRYACFITEVLEKSYLLHFNGVLFSATHMQLLVRQKQPPGVFYEKRCSYKFRKIYKKIPVPESLF